MKSKLARRLAAPFAVATALVAAPLLTATPAYAGGYCTVVHDNAPIYAKDSVGSRIVLTIDKGVTVTATGGPSYTLWKVSHAGNGDHLGFMQQADLTCGGG